MATQSVWLRLNRWSQKADLARRLELALTIAVFVSGTATFAALTRTGLTTLRKAWPHHLRSVRKRAFGAFHHGAKGRLASGDDAGAGA